MLINEQKDRIRQGYEKKVKQLEESQIMQMISFIVHEAQEKAKVSQHKGVVEFHIEVHRRITDKIRQGYERKVTVIQQKGEVEFSAKLASQCTVLKLLVAKTVQ